MCAFPFPDQGRKKYLALTFNQGTKIHSKYRKWRAFNTGDWSSRRGKHGAPKQRAEGALGQAKGKGVWPGPGAGSRSPMVGTRE